MNSIYTSIISDFPKIVDFAYRKNPKTFWNITEIFGEQQSNLFKLLQILKIAEKLQHNSMFYDYSGIQEKFSEATSWHKLLSFESELCFANELANLDFFVSFVSDSSSEWKEDNQTLPSPDLYAEKDNIKFLIEIAKIKDDETTHNIANSITSVIRETKFRVWIQYCEEFSHPVISHKEREEREKLINDFVAEFKRVITKVDPQLLTHTANIFGCKVELTQLSLQCGYYAGCTTGVVLNPADYIKPRIQFELEKKAAKRLKWKEEHKKIPYIVALDIRQNWLYKENFISLLFGSKCYTGLIKSSISGIPNFSESSLVIKAKNNGWRDFLINIGFNPKIDSPIRQPGILITNSTISKNLTGIIARIKDDVLYIPNPFAEQQINFLDWDKYFPSHF